MKKSILWVIGFTVTAALLFIGCEDSASPNYQGNVDGFLVRVNEKSGSGGGSGVYTVTVSSIGEGATKSRNCQVGVTVDINAGIVDGRPFERWTTASKGVTFADANSATTTFNMPANDVTVTAVFVPFTVTLESNGAGASGGGKYYPGETVSIKAGTPPNGFVFNGWVEENYESNVVFANASNTTTTFIMPSSDVYISAIFFGIPTPNDTSTFDYGGQTYKTVVIGGKRWMAENLNYDPADGSGSWCYDNQDSNCVKYGRLYNWNTAKVACPSGWHLPDTAEWRRLVETAGGIRTAGSKLKSSSGWDSYSGIGSTDEFQFSALPGGYRLSSGSFGGAGFSGRWWAATGSNAYRRDVNYNSDTMNEYSSEKDVGYSVRCVMDDVR